MAKDTYQTIADYLATQKQSEHHRIVQKINEDYQMLRDSSKENRNSMPKLSKYKNSEAYKKELDEEIEKSYRLKFLNQENILENEEFIIEYEKYKKRIIARNKKRETEKIKRLELQQLRQDIKYAIASYLKSEDKQLLSYTNEMINIIVKKYTKTLTNQLKTKKVLIGSGDDEYFDAYYVGLSINTFNALYESIGNQSNAYFINNFRTFITLNLPNKNFSIIKYEMQQMLLNNCSSLHNIVYQHNKKITESDLIATYKLASDFYVENLCINKILPMMKDSFTIEKILEIISNNKYYKEKVGKFIELYEEIKETERREKELQESILKTMPQNYIDLYPLARKMKRHFILHIGGTNSGKTYTAMEKMRECGEGIYLAPLRLLAYEQFDRLNKDGYFCTLLTGEEKLEVPFSTFQSSTVEMLDLSIHYKIAVIDEAQMVDDKFRGGAWTRAILGIRANEIHICAAPEAEEVLKKMIVACSDTYEIQYHTRNTKLTTENERFEFTTSIKKGDALIVFSRRSVHSVANELKKKNIKCSIIYGALPYDVRQNEANKFANGDTDVVVTTDAIGMGLNLPIKRVVFLETRKFDGEEVRELNPQEIKQIAGRAGRYKIFDEGFVNSYDDQDVIFSKLNKKLPQIQEVFIQFPESLIGLDSDLSKTLEKWNDIEVQPGFKKADVTHEIKLAQLAEKITMDKKIIYDFITIPFDDENESLLELWREMLIAYTNDVHLNFFDIKPTYELMDLKPEDLTTLEQAYKVCDLIYYYNEKFEQSQDSKQVMHCKEEISKAIMTLLEKEQFSARKCRICGKPLSWNTRYNICDKCHRKSIYNPYYY